jgi:hypothetical protein
MSPAADDGRKRSPRKDHPVTTKLRARTAGIVAAVALTACSHAVTTQADAAARIDSGTALNTGPGAYRVSDVDVMLVKMVALPNDMLGLRFSFGSASPNCCGVFPRIALEQTPAGVARARTDVVIPGSAITSSGTIEMRLSERGHATVPFTVDLAAIGAASS